MADIDNLNMDELFNDPALKKWQLPAPPVKPTRVEPHVIIPKPKQLDEQQPKPFNRTNCFIFPALLELLKDTSRPM